MKMHLAMLAVALVLSGCAATKQEVSDNLGNRFLGKNVDTLVSEFGPPASAFRMSSGETAYVWQLSAVTNINTDGGSGTAKTNYCKVSVISSPTGIVTKLTTEDASGTGGLLGLAGSTSMEAFVQDISGCSDKGSRAARSFGHFRNGD
jgi:hypothetical protein